MSTAQVPFLSPEVMANPYPLYHRLRAEKPVAWVEGMHSWLLTRFDDINDVLRDGKTFSSARGQDALAKADNPAAQAMVKSRSNSMLNADGTQHARLRALVSKAFSPKTVEAMRPRIQELVDGMLDKVAANGRMDVMEDLAFPLPVTVIAAMLGIPAEERERFKDWSDKITILANPGPSIKPQHIEQAVAAYGELTEYLRGIVARLKLTPDTSLLAAMAAAEEAGEKLNETELYANAVTLLNAGHETTTNLIGNGTRALLKNPDQFEALKSNPDLVENAVEELLRFDSPVQFTSRIATEDVTVGGQAIAAGQSLVCVLGAANRDPSHFNDPDKLDLTRSNLKHVAFGFGPHYCLGASLARIEGQVVFSTLAKRFPNMKIDGADPVYRENFNLRGLTALHVVF